MEWKHRDKRWNYVFKPAKNTFEREPKKVYINFLTLNLNLKKKSLSLLKNVIDIYFPKLLTNMILGLFGTRISAQRSQCNFASNINRVISLLVSVSESEREQRGLDRRGS